MKSLTESHVTVMVSELDAAIEFYSETLGLMLRNRYGDFYAVMEVPGLTIGLHPTEEKIKVGNNLSIGFAVDDFNMAVDHLRSKGLRPDTKEDGWSRLAHFADPDGNLLYLIENQLKTDQANA